MANRYLILFLLSFASCSSVRSVVSTLDDAAPAPSVTPSQIGVGDILFVPDMRFNSKLEAEKILSAGKKLNEVRKSQCFFDALKNRKMIETNGKTSEEVAVHLQSVSGSIPVQWYYSRFTSAVAYRNVGSPIIHFNRKYFSYKSSDCSIASTLGHEAIAHVLGEYGHSFKWTKERDYSVPYSINYAIDLCCLQK